MNQELTQAEAKRVEQAAEKHVKVAASGLTVLPTEQWKMFVDGYLEGFTAGASFATTDPEMMKAMLKPFAEWLGEKYTVVVLEESNIWRRYNSSEYFTTEELISKYITDKQKENGATGV